MTSTLESVTKIGVTQRVKTQTQTQVTPAPAQTMCGAQNVKANFNSIKITMVNHSFSMCFSYLEPHS